MSEVRALTFESLAAGAGPPTSDDVPMTLDWEPLDTREKLVAFLEAINRRRATTDGDSNMFSHT